MAIYICQKCNATSTAFSLSCTKCGEWGSIMESAALTLRNLGNEPPQVIADIKTVVIDRIKSNIGEFDRTVGGGIVPGTAILIGGDPGIGKSTILLQIVNKLPKDTRILYVSSEESVSQTRVRAERLKITHPALYIVSENNVSRIAEYLDNLKPAIVVIDSIQMVYKPEINSAPGTVTQVRESAADLIYLAKKNGAILFLIGHITKDGSLAGPKTLEHLVDTVLYFEGDRFQSFRILRATKNRFGATNEIGMFEMKDTGLVEVTNPSEFFISHGKSTAGTALACTMIGSRPFIVEIEALTSITQGVPVRRVSGVDSNRAIMVTAVLERRCGITIHNMDVYINVVGGLKTDEPAADLGIAMAIYSSAKNISLPDIVFIGEVGLTGEIRAVSSIDTRVKEAVRLGFKKIIVPEANKIDNVTKVSYLSKAIEIVEEF